MADRLTEAVLYELLETGTEEGVYVEAFDVRAPVTVAELAGALLASQAELARQTAELAGELIAARALNTKLLAEAKRERERAAEHAEALDVLRGFTDDGETIVDAARRITADSERAEGLAQSLPIARDAARRTAITDALRAMEQRRDLTLGSPNDRLVAAVLMDEVRALLGADRHARPTKESA